MIRVREGSVIGDDGEPLGIIPTEEAIIMAQDQGMDLVEVAPNYKPPVCRIMDYCKHKYKASKKAHEAKKNQKVVHIKEVKFRPNTDQHDFDFKMKHVQRFLENGYKAKVVFFFKGREIVHREFGQKVLERIVDQTEDIAIIEQSAKQEGRTLVMVLAPKNAKSKKGTQAKAPKPVVEKAVEENKREGASAEATAPNNESVE